MKWIKKNIVEILLVLVSVVGLCFMLYPTVSNYWNRFHQSRAIADYTETVAAMDDGESEKILEVAKAYNAALAQNQVEYNLSEESMAEYEKQLDISGLGIMGHIEIPKINCSLPIYHGTDESVLQIATGHIEWTSLPVGGESTHCVIAGHSGLSSAKLFSDLEQMEIGDIFQITVLTETLTYEVDQIQIVLPENIDSLKIVKGKDLCTLMTCTPYGINTHRLLVRGHRIANPEESENDNITPDAVPVQKTSILVVTGILILVLLVIMIVRKKCRRR